MKKLAGTWNHNSFSNTKLLHVVLWRYYVTHPRGDRGARYGEGLGRLCVCVCIYVKTWCRRKGHQVRDKKKRRMEVKPFDWLFERFVLGRLRRRVGIDYCLLNLYAGERCSVRGCQSHREGWVRVKRFRFHTRYLYRKAYGLVPSINQQPKGLIVCQELFCEERNEEDGCRSKKQNFLTKRK